MFDIGWTELLLIGLVALIVVGPKDLPGMFRTLGQFTAKAKRMAREFTQAMEAAADEAGVKDVTKTLRDATNPSKMGLDAVKKAADFDTWKPGAETDKLAKDRADAAKTLQNASVKPAHDSEAVSASKPAKAETAPPKSSKTKTAKPKPAKKDET